MHVEKQSRCLVGVYAPKTHFKGLAPINEVKEVLIHISCHLSTVTKNVLNMANSAGPDETPRYAASHLDLRYLQRSLFWNILHKCIYHVPTIANIEF